jgi:ABC-type sugar transport system substrate-binding protein
MKKFLMIAIVAVLTVALLACSTTAAPAASSAAAAPASSAAAAPASSAAAAPASSVAAAPATSAAAAKTTTLKIGMYADGADSYYQAIKDTLVACAAEDPTCKWTVDYKVGQNTAAEQLQAVEDFITAKYDAMVVIQNSVDTTSKCIAEAKAANIPYFGAAQPFASAANATDAAGSCAFDFLAEGKYAGAAAAKAGAKKCVMIEGQLGQGAAGDQTKGYILAYQEAGKKLGGVTAKDIYTNKSQVKQDGTQEFQVVSWASGGWFADPAQKAMTDAITSLGPKGFDSVYAENNPMMEGVLAALKDAGLDPTKYFLSSGNGREESWAWVQAGTIQADVNQSAALEGDVIYQQIKAYFNGTTYRKYIHPYLTEYDTSNIATLVNSLVPFTDTKTYMSKRDANAFVHDINDPKFVDIADFGNATPPDPT